MVCITAGILSKYSKTGTVGSNLLVVQIRQYNNLPTSHNKHIIFNNTPFLYYYKKAFQFQAYLFPKCI
jgi:hypothetical protein